MMEVKLAQNENELPEMRRVREIQLSYKFYEYIRSSILKCIDELILTLVQVPEYGPKSFNLEYSCTNPKDEVIIKEIQEKLPIDLVMIIKQQNNAISK